MNFKLVPFSEDKFVHLQGDPKCDASQTAVSFEKDLDLVRKQKEKLDFEQRTVFFSKTWGFWSKMSGEKNLLRRSDAVIES